MQNQLQIKNQKTVLYSELLNENSLLVISKEDIDEYPCLSIHYEYNELIYEVFIASLTPEVAVQYNDKVVAIFINNNQSVRRQNLSTLYDLEHHEFVENHFIHLYYDVETKNGAKVKHLMHYSK